MSRITAAWILAITLATHPQDDKKAKEEEAKKKLDEYRTALKKAKTETEIADAINELGKVQHPKVLAELKVWLTKSAKEPIEAAAEQIGKYFKDKEAAESLLTAAPAIKDPTLAAKCVRCAGITKVKSIASRLVTLYRHKELDVAHAAIDSSGLIRSKECVSPLIALMKELEGIKEESNAGSPLGDAGDAAHEEQLKRKQALLDPAREALRAITGEKWQLGKEWEAWWKKAQGKFKDPD